MVICLSIYTFDLFKNNFELKDKIKSASIILFALIVSTIFNLIVLKDTSSKNVLNRAASISLSTNDGSVNQRLRYYKQGLQQFKENPLMGVGLGNWKLNSIEYDKNDISGYVIPYHAHNDFIQILAEQGFFGMFFYLMIFLSTLAFIFKNKILDSYDTRFVVLLSMILVFILDSMLNFPIARPINQIQIMLVLSSVIINKIDNEK
jgi:O-antigen ligase